ADGPISRGFRARRNSRCRPARRTPAAARAVLSAARAGRPAGRRLLPVSRRDWTMRFGSQKGEMNMLKTRIHTRGALAGLSLILLATMPATAAEQITFVSQGGAYQKAQTIAILDPAAKKLGITINQDSIPDAWPAIKTQVGSGKPIWDVVDTPTGYCLRGGQQGLIEKLDFPKMPN